MVGCRIDIIKAQATEKRGNDMLHTLEKGEEVWREGLFKYRDVYIARW